jgi:hypothetical protein
VGVGYFLVSCLVYCAGALPFFVLKLRSWLKGGGRVDELSWADDAFLL